MTRAGLERAGRILTALFGVGFLLLGLRYFADPGAPTTWILRGLAAGTHP